MSAATIETAGSNGSRLRPVPSPTETPTIYQLMARVMADVRPVGKDSRNVEQNYNFRGIDAVVNAVNPVLRTHGVIVIPEVLEVSYRDVTTSRGKPSRECTVKVRYRFYGPSGDYIDAVTVGEAMDFGDKGTPKAMSVAFRVALLQALCLPTDDTDPDAQSYDRAYRDEHAVTSFEERPPSGPSKEQMAAYDEAAKRIAAANSVESLKAVWVQILADNKAGKIHDVHGEPLSAARNAQLAELNGAGA